MKAFIGAWELFLALAPDGHNVTPAPTTKSPTFSTYHKIYHIHLVLSNLGTSMMSLSVVLADSQRNLDCQKTMGKPVSLPK